MPEAMLRAIYRQVVSEVLSVEGADGCQRHPSGRVTVFGGNYSVKRVLWEEHHGFPVPPRRILVRTCSTPDCHAADHLIAITREQWGKVLGSAGGAWRPAQTN
jgi:hypothetical protein